MPVLVIRRLSGTEIATPPGCQTSADTSESVSAAEGGDALRLLDPSWDRLVLAQPVPNPTLLGPWLRAAATLHEDPPLVVAVHDHSGAVAGGAFRIRRLGGRGGPRVASWLGPTAFQNSPDLITEPRAGGGPGALVVSELLDRVRLVHLPMTVLSGNAADAFQTALPHSRMNTLGETFFVPLPSPRVESVRRSAARSLRRASRAGVRVSITVHSTPADVRPALERMFRLYRHAWHQREGEMGRFARTADQRAAYRRALDALAGAGHVRVVEVTENGRPIAAQLGLLAGRGALAHTTALARDGSLHGAGNIALLAWVEEATTAGAQVMDLSRGGGEPGGPKRRLGAGPAPWGTVIAARSRPLQQGFVAALRIRHRIPQGLRGRRGFAARPGR
jgi:CelD/BcsL family acetyltransferase involved in cellulose biosynthesis